MSIDLQAIIRRRKPEKHRQQLAPRRHIPLARQLDVLDRMPPALVLDTTVYIHRAAGSLDLLALGLVDQALLFHSSVALAELATGVANADPKRPGWSVVRDHYAELFEDIHTNRLLSPDPQVWADAGIIAGILARTQRFQPHQRKECLNDALIYLSAAKAGIPVLTSNRDDFDLIHQIAPEGRIIHY